MGPVHEGGCLCGAVRYRTTAQPLRVTFCHCTFCQRITGAAYLVEPIFKRADVSFSGAAPKAYHHRSDGSGKRVTVNFCETCGTTLYLDLERFPEIFAVFAGSFDDPGWFERGEGVGRHIFTRSAQEGVMLPAGIETYADHALQLDGTANVPVVLAHATLVKRRT